MSVLGDGLCLACLRAWVRKRFGIRSRDEFTERVYVLDDTHVEVDSRIYRIPARCRTCGHEQPYEPVGVRGMSDLGKPYHEQGPHTVPGHF